MIKAASRDTLKNMFTGERDENFRCDWQTGECRRALEAQVGHLLGITGERTLELKMDEKRRI